MHDLASAVPGFLKGRLSNVRASGNMHIQAAVTGSCQTFPLCLGELFCLGRNLTVISAMTDVFLIIFGERDLEGAAFILIADRSQALNTACMECAQQHDRYHLLRFPVTQPNSCGREFFQFKLQTVGLKDHDLGIVGQPTVVKLIDAGAAGKDADHICTTCIGTKRFLDLLHGKTTAQIFLNRCRDLRDQKMHHQVICGERAILRRRRHFIGLVVRSAQNKLNSSAHPFTTHGVSVDLLCRFTHIFVILAEDTILLLQRVDQRQITGRIVFIFYFLIGLFQPLGVFSQI